MKQADLIWMNGELIPWDEAKVHVLTHGLHYGTGVFEGIRAYWNEEKQQLYALQLREHFERIHRSAKVLKLDLRYSVDELIEITPKTIRLRKRVLTANDRKKAARAARVADAS